ncbi:5-hydroxytryptamine receptor [Leguminivora glycinivorella]|uniref:5-hydroxytryptamine receptor n=1 Tax=Leguminivora glycinivorella TaxID=1035111 RepID=UPI00201075E2|nr:5-hydroxytryptamine receptor [Leguminivora glycinivorella]XP_047988291.1 5-hydroxytryptamine receptor [Leguminivora glycinivorella]XP_047988292.1 5-hydroxytryptamine receptor [Leguminivora glycinivorella]
MGGADGGDLLEWEALYLRLPGSSNHSWNATEWVPEWNATEVSNVSWWDSSAPFDSTAALVRAAAKAVVLGLLILATVVGNVFVIAAILLERHLRSAANQLILSLAVADLLVACLVMPLGAVYEVAQRWTLGPELCDMWTSGDVLCCTASILHLVAIALDRYWAVTNIDYIHARTAKRVGAMIACVWVVSFLVCIAPLLGWKDPDWDRRVSEDLRCLISQDVGYQIFATASSFYVPVLVILILYWRIYQTARKRIRRRRGATARGGVGPPPVPAGGALVAAGGSGGIAAAVVAVIGRPLPTISETTTTGFTNVSSNNTSPEKQSCVNGLEQDPPTTGYGAVAAAYYPTLVKRKPKEAADSKRERKAAKTLAIITGAFVACWLPFFVLAILMPTCGDCEVSPVLTSFSLWLGYFNSTLNPVIYTVFSPEFRHAFQRLLCGRRARRRRAPP